MHVFMYKATYSRCVIQLCVVFIQDSTNLWQEKYDEFDQLNVICQYFSYPAVSIVGFSYDVILGNSQIVCCVCLQLIVHV